MPSFGFIGPAYQGRSPVIACEQLFNLFPELQESSNSASKGTKYNYYGTPGTSVFCATGASSIRALWGGNNALYAVADGNLIQINSSGSVIATGAIGTASGPAQIVGGPSGVSAALLVWDGSSGASGPNTWWVAGLGVTAPVPVISSLGITYCNGYFIALRPGGADFAGDPIPINTADQTQFNVSAILDGSTWNPLNYAIKTGAPDALQMIFGPATPGGGPEELWLLGKKTIEVWYAVPGTALNPFPFQQVQGAFINQGLWAKMSVAGLADGIYYLAGDDRGVGMVVRMNGYIPQRVSTHAIEYLIQSWIAAGSDVSTATGYGYQEQGHNFYVLTFPGNGTIVYDATENLWHQRATITGSAGSLSYAQAKGQQFHAATFGLHLVADLNSGNIYSQSLSTYQDDGSPLWRVRASPHLDMEQLWTYYDQLQLDFGPYPPASTATFYLEISDDGGQTFNPPITVVVGSGGTSPSRAVWRRLGRSRNRVFRVSTSNAVAQAWVDAYLRMRAGTGL
jgi:hypothetical protein